jgi:hypothetical protein
MNEACGERGLAPDDPDMYARLLPLPADLRPTLFVVIDTEEEFDWDAPLSRANTSVRSIRRLGRLQRLFERFGVVPTYAIDYPVASQPDGYRPIKEFADAGACTIAAHLHPWVNPPFAEQVSARNSYGCNLPPALERDKIQRLLDEIEAHIGMRPKGYKAGRYGFGRSTVVALPLLGIDVDLSISPHMDYGADGGPSFVSFSARPFFFGADCRLLELPCTAGYTGVAGGVGPRLHDLASRSSLSRLHLVGLLARARVVNKVRLSPEGHPAHELRQLTLVLAASGVRTFSLTLHSSSLEPGHTPYARTMREVEELMTRIERYLDFFLGKLDGASSTPNDFRAWVKLQRLVVGDSRMTGAWS